MGHNTHLLQTTSSQLSSHRIHRTMGQEHLRTSLPGRDLPSSRGCCKFLEKAAIRSFNAHRNRTHRVISLRRFLIKNCDDLQKHARSPKRPTEPPNTPHTPTRPFKRLRELSPRSPKRFHGRSPSKISLPNTPTDKTHSHNRQIPPRQPTNLDDILASFRYARTQLNRRF